MSTATFATLLLAAPASSYACTISWSGGAGNNSWQEAANWTPERQPDATDHVCIPPSATVEVSQEVGSVLTVAGDGKLSLLPGAVLRLTAYSPA